MASEQTKRSLPMLRTVRRSAAAAHAARRHWQRRREVGICYACHNRVLLDERRLCIACGDGRGPLRVVIEH